MADKPVRADKASAVAELTDHFRNSSATVLTEYRGLTVKQLTELRRSLGRAGRELEARRELVQALRAVREEMLRRELREEQKGQPGFFRLARRRDHANFHAKKPAVPSAIAMV